jgi:nitroimidazol reductase NimA-like FMN-containing flavoprotein (pyridoxamine 5'-phosphate oxidase superfamily)
MKTMTTPHNSRPSDDDIPPAELDARFSSPGAEPTEWAQVRRHVDDAEVFWLTTVRSDGRPHVTPLLSVWLDGALYFCTGPGERKAANLAEHPHCVLTTGGNRLDDGLDVVVEGRASKVSAAAELHGIADAFETKYGRHFTSPEGTWHGLGDAVRDGGEGILVFRVAPSTVFGFDKGKQFGQTRWRFERR